MNDQLDPQAMALTKAIRQVESGGNFKARSKDGSFGAYQFLKPTWDNTARKYGVNAEWEKATPQQQNEVAYKQIKEWKDKGHNVGEIASMWNAGAGRPQAYLQGLKGTNSSGVNYNVANYAKKVATLYQGYKGQSQPQAQQEPIEPVEPIEPTIPEQKQVIQTQGQPVSVRKDRTQPTLVGGILREVIKAPLKAALSVARPFVDPFGKKGGLSVNTKYLGNVGDYGTEIEKSTDVIDKKYRAGDISLGRAAIGGVGAGTLQAMDLASVVPVGGVASQAVKGTVNKAVIPVFKAAAKESLVRGGVIGTGYDVSNQLASGEKYKPLQTLAAGTIGTVADFGLSYGLPKTVAGTKSFAKNNLTKTGRDAKLTRKVEEELRNVENNYAKLRKNQKFSKDANTETRKRIIASGVLDDATDTTGTINTDNAIKKYRDASGLTGNEGVVRENLERLGEKVNLKSVEKELTDSIYASGLEGAELRTALNNVKKEISGYRLRADANGDVPLTFIHDTKIGTTSGINFMTPPEVKAYKKALASGLRSTVENNSQFNVKEVNQELSPLFKDIEYLESLNGRKVKGGKLGKYASQITGNIVGGAVGGAIGGFPGSAIGTVVGGEAGSSLMGSSLSKVLRGPGAKELPVSKVLQKAAATAKSPRLGLPEPKAGLPKSQNFVPIELPGVKEPVYRSPRIAGNTTQYTNIPNTKPKNIDIPTELPKSKVKSSDLSIEVKNSKFKKDFDFLKKEANDLSKDEFKKIYGNLFEKINRNNPDIIKPEVLGKEGFIKSELNNPQGNKSFSLDTLLGNDAPKQYKNTGIKVEFGGNDIGMSKEGEIIGRFIPRRNTIQVSKSLYGQELEDVLMHEIEHALQFKGNPTLNKTTKYDLSSVLTYEKSTLEKIANSNQKKRLNTNYKSIDDFYNQSNKKGIIGNAIDTLKTLKDKNVRERGSISLESILPESKSVRNQGVSLAKNTTEDLIQQAKKYKSAEEFVKAQLDKNTIKLSKPLTVYRGEGKGIGNTTLVNGRYFAGDEKFASTFGNVTKSEVPAGTKIFDLDSIKNGNGIVSETSLVDTTKLTDFLIDNGYTYTKNTNSRGVEYVKLARTAESSSQRVPVDSFRLLDSRYKDVVNKYKTFDAFYKQAQKISDDVFNKTGKYEATNYKMLKEYFNQVKNNKIPVTNLKPESQLEEIWNKANKKVTLPKSSDLSTEAKKYKSAEEFVNDNAKYYKGFGEKPNGPINKTIDKKADWGEGIYITESMPIAEDYAQAFAKSGAGHVENISIAKNAKIADLTSNKELVLNYDDFLKLKNKYKNELEKNSAAKYILDTNLTNENIIYKRFDWEGNKNMSMYSAMQDILQRAGVKDTKTYINNLIESKGYDGIEVLQSYTADLPLGKEDAANFILFNPDIIKTKSQLIDIWNKTNKKILPKNTKLIRNKDGSVEYGSQKMSGDFKGMPDIEIIKMFDNTPF